MERSEHKIVCKLKCQQRHISLIPVEVQYLAVQNASLFLIRTGNASVEQNIRVILSLKKTFGQSFCPDGLGMLQNKHTDHSSGESWDTYGRLNIFILKTQLRGKS